MIKETYDESICLNCYNRLKCLIDGQINGDSVRCNVYVWRLVQKLKGLKKAK